MTLEGDKPKPEPPSAANVALVGVPTKDDDDDSDSDNEPVLDIEDYVEDDPVRQTDRQREGEREGGREISWIYSSCCTPHRLLRQFKHRYQ